MFHGYFDDCCFHEQVIAVNQCLKPTSLLEALCLISCLLDSMGVVKIHVFDEARCLRQDFTCENGALLSSMQ